MTPRLRRREPRALSHPLSIGALVVASLGCAGRVSAQDASILIDPVIPLDYDQNRNVSVLEKPRSDYDPLGVRVGGFNVYPQLDAGVGATSNAYLTPDNKQSDGYAIVHPAVDAQSDWNRHQVLFSADATLRRYFSESPLNRNEWNVRSLGRYDIGDYSSATIEAQLSRLQEQPFTSQLDAPLAVLSSYRRDYVALRGEREAGRARLVASVDVTNLRFSPIDFADGTELSQVDRSRRIVTGAVQGEYSLSPGAVLYGQLSYSDTNYFRNTLLTGGDNRDSKSWRVLGGINLDIPGSIRGTIGLGYTQRNYDSPTYRTIGGLSVQTELTWFLTEQTNIKAAARRLLEDSAIEDNSGYFDNLFSVGVDHELLRNVLIGADGSYGIQDYVHSPLRYHIVQGSGYVRYLASRRLHLRLDASIGSRKRVGSDAGSRITEGSGALTIEYHL